MSKGLKIANAISNEISKNTYSKKGPAKQQHMKGEKESAKEDSKETAADEAAEMPKKKPFGKKK